MKRASVLFLFIVVAIGAAFLALWILGLRSGPEREGAIPFPRPELIRTALPGRRDFPLYTPFFGMVESPEYVTIISPETGEISAVDAADEMPLKKGTPLFTLGGPLIESRMKILGTRVSALRKEVRLGQNVVDIRKGAVEQKLAKREELMAAEGELAHLETGLKDAERELLLLQNAIHLRAPLDGVFTGRKVSPGQAVEKGDAIAELVPTEGLRVTAALFPAAGTALIVKDAVINLPEGGYISGVVVKELFRRTEEGAVIVWIEGPDIDERLNPGVTVSGKLLLSLHRDALAVPEEAVVIDEQYRTYLFLKAPDGYRKQPVKTGIVSDGQVEIVSGLKEGDEVVVLGAYELFYRDFNRVFRVAD